MARQDGGLDTVCDNPVADAFYIFYGVGREPSLAK
jgi:hypothetical protein